MYKIEVHNRVYQMISLLHVTGIWECDNRSKFFKWFLRIMNFSAFVYYPIGFFGASLLSDKKSDTIFMLTASLTSCVIIVRVYYFIRYQDQIIELVRALGTHIIRKKELHQVYHEIDTNIKRFMGFTSYFASIIVVDAPIAAIAALPFIVTEKHLPLNIYFPLNWKDNQIIYWFAFLFAAYTILVFAMCTILQVIVWYLLMSCAIKYKILGNEFKNMGVISMKKITLMQKQNMFIEELIELIQNHQHLQDLTNKFKSVFSNLFFIQIITSGLTICGTLFVIAFTSTDNPIEYVTYVLAVLYTTFEIFMVTYFGNEIKLWSSRLSYCIFECDWMDQSISCKKNMIILMEVLKRPQQLIIGKMYPLDLQLFSKILNFAYSMFNVLMNFKSNK